MPSGRPGAHPSKGRRRMSQSLRTEVLRKGSYLVFRQGAGTLIGLVGILLLARLIGPANYGLYAAAGSIYTFLQLAADWGILVHLQRRRTELSDADLHAAFTLLSLLGMGFVGLGLLCVPFLSQYMGLEAFGPVACTLILGLPLVLGTQIPLAKLERAMDYRRVVIAELGGQVAFYVAALPLAFKGAGVWAPTVGWWAQQLTVTLCLFPLAGYRPRLRWDMPAFKDMLGYGVGYSASRLLWQGRALINPLVVGPLAGAAGMGYVALAIRLTDALSFVLRAAQRISTAALARVQSDERRMVQAVTEGMRLQLLAMGPFLVAFAWLGPWLMPLLFGEKWLSALSLFPFIAVSILGHAMFKLHASVLYVLERTWSVTAFHLAHLGLFAGTAYLLVGRLGIVGYGLAEIVALAAYGFIHLSMARHVGSPDYRLAMVWAAGFGMSLFVHPLGWWTALGLVVALAWPASRHTLHGYATNLWQLRAQSA